MTVSNSTEYKDSLLSTLEDNLLSCFSHLNVILTVCDQNITHIKNGRKDVTTDLYVHDSFFSNLGKYIDTILEINERSSQNRLLEKEIRETLLSHDRDRHDEIYFVSIRNVMKNLERCRLERVRYSANRNEYNNYILTYFSSTGEETPEYALGVLNKLVSMGSRDFTNSLLKLSFSIKSVIPPSDLRKILSEESITSIDQESVQTQISAKLKWNCKPAVVGYIISELIRAGYIDPPTTNGELSYAKLAAICNDIFDIRSNRGPTTVGYLEKVLNEASNQLSEQKRAKLNLPDLDRSDRIHRS